MMTIDKRIDILFKEYDSLRAEVIDRMKLTFSHLGYLGAIAVFAIPVSKSGAVTYQSQLRSSHFRNVAKLWLLVLWIKFTPVELLEMAQKNLRFIPILSDDSE